MIRLADAEAVLPSSPFGILRALVDHAERQSPHAGALRFGAVAGRQRDYLADLAGSMRERGGTLLPEAAAVATIAATAVRVGTPRAGGPSPLDVLDGLCAHHLLERTHDGHAGAFQFVHEQVQEWFGSAYLLRKLQEAARREEDARSFRALYLNQPAWEQECLFLAEQLGEDAVGDAAARGATLVSWALDLDPVFAGDLARRCGERAWGVVRDRFAKRLRAWHALPGWMHHERALAAMVAAGQDDFRDILVPLLESSDQQVRLRALRAHRAAFSPRALGADWRQRFATWTAEQRADFVGEIGRSADAEARTLVTAAVRDDPSPEVRLEALMILADQGATETLVEILRDAASELWRLIAGRGLGWLVPDELVGRYREALQDLLRALPPSAGRNGVIAELAGGATNAAALAEIGTEDLIGRVDLSADNGFAVLARIASLAPEAAANRTADQLKAHGRLPNRVADGLLAALPIARLDQLVADAVDAPAMRVDENRLRPLAPLLRATHCRHLLRAYLAAAEAFDPAMAVAGRETATAFRAALIRLLAEVQVGPLLETAAQLARDVHPPRVRDWLIDLLAGAGQERTESGDRSGRPVRNAAFGRLREVVERWVAEVVAAGDPWGHAPARLATFVGRFAEPEDLPLLERLVDCELQRLREHRSSVERWRAVGVRPTHEGYALRYSNLYVNALLDLDPPDLDGVLRQLLEDPEFEQPAAAALVRRYGRSPEALEANRGFRLSFDYLAAARERLRARAGQPMPLAIEAVCRHVRGLLEEAARLPDGQPSELRGRLAGLGCRLAFAEHTDVVPLVLAAVRFGHPRWGGYDIIDALEALVRAGQAVDGPEAAACIDPVLECSLSDPYEPERGKERAVRIASVLLLTSRPELGVHRVRRVLDGRRPPAPWELRGFFAAAEHAAHPDVLALLIEPRPGWDESRERLQAISRIGGPMAEDALHGIILKAGQRASAWSWHELAEPVADLARRSERFRARLCAACRLSLTAGQQAVLAATFEKVGTEDVALAALELLDDGSREALPWVARVLRKMFVAEVPEGDIANAYSLESTARPLLRSRLFELTLRDGPRRRSALDLLVQIDRWRDEHGKPLDEPRHPGFAAGTPWPDDGAFAGWA